MPPLTNYDKGTHIFIFVLNFIEVISIATTRGEGNKW